MQGMQLWVRQAGGAGSLDASWPLQPLQQQQGQCGMALIQSGASHLLPQHPSAAPTPWEHPQLCFPPPLPQAIGQHGLPGCLLALRLGAATLRGELSVLLAVQLSPPGAWGAAGEGAAAAAVQEVAAALGPLLMDPCSC